MIKTKPIEEYLLPHTVEEALNFAQAHKGRFKYLAGGTDLMVNRFQQNENSVCLIDLTKIESLKGINITGNVLRIGSLEFLEAFKNNAFLQKEFPMLIEAALAVGSPLIRKSATIGGNVLCENRCLYYNQTEWWRESVGYCLKCDGDICIATGGKNACFSEMISDTAPALIAMGASIEVADENGTIQKPLESIYTGDGVNPRNLSETAIITSFLLPLNRNFKTAFYKLRERQSLDFTSLTLAAALDSNNKLKIALSGIDPKPVVVETDYKADKNDLLRKILKAARSVDNDMYSRIYRRQMIEVFLNKCFETLCK